MDSAWDCCSTRQTATYIDLTREHTTGPSPYVVTNALGSAHVAHRMRKAEEKVKTSVARSQNPTHTWQPGSGWHQDTTLTEAKVVHYTWEPVEPVKQVSLGGGVFTVMQRESLGSLGLTVQDRRDGGVGVMAVHGESARKGVELGSILQAINGADVRVASATEVTAICNAIVRPVTISFTSEAEMTRMKKLRQPLDVSESPELQIPGEAPGVLTEESQEPSKRRCGVCQ